MKYTDRREFLYDSDIFKRQDVQIALKIHDEYVRRHSGKPYPKFFEVDRQVQSIDPLWHAPVAGHTQFSRTLDVPSIVQFEKLQWNLLRQGRIPQQKLKFWVGNLTLKELNYFPLQGDLIYHNGYRLEITHVEFEPNSYWQQTQVWLGIIYVAQIVPEGDARPTVNPSIANLPEQTTTEPFKEEVTGKLQGKIPGNPVPDNKV
jgi:hypothetical protein